MNRTHKVPVVIVPKINEQGLSAHMTKNHEKKFPTKTLASPVWRYFNKFPIEKVAQCQICNKKFNFRHQSTSNLLRHCKSVHSIKFDDIPNDFQIDVPTKKSRIDTALVKPENIDIEDSEQVSVSSPSKNSKSTPNRYEPKHTEPGLSEKYNENLSYIVIKGLAIDLAPFSSLEKKGISQIFKKLNSKVKLPNKDNFMSLQFSKELETAKTNISLMLSACTDCCLSADIWRYRNQDMITFFAHFVNSSYELKSFVVSTISGPDNESAGGISASIQSLSEEMKFSDKVFALISDGTSEDLKTATATATYTHLTCFGHSLNTLILVALNNVSEITRLRAKVLTIMKYFNENVKSAQQLVLVQKQNDVPVVKLPIENFNNWMTIFEMFSQILIQFEAINTVLCLQDNNDMCILDAEIDTIREIVDILLPFAYVCKELSSDYGIHLSMALPLANLLAQNVSQRLETAKDICLQFLNLLQTEIEKHFNDIESNHVVAISTLLDPRFKQFAFQNQESMEAAEDKLVEELHSLVSSSKTDKGRKQTLDINGRMANDLWKSFENKISMAGAVSSNLSNARNEVKRYLKEPVIARKENPLEWWQLNQLQFPTVTKLAKKYLSLPVTAKRAELIFTSEAMEVEKQREALQPDILFDMIFLNSYFYSI